MIFEERRSIHFNRLPIFCLIYLDMFVGNHNLFFYEIKNKKIKICKIIV